MGEGVGTKPTDNQLLVELGTIFAESARKRRRYVISRLNRNVKEMVLEDDRVCDDMSCPVEIPELTITIGTWQPVCHGRPQGAHTGNPREEDGPDEDIGDNDPPVENPPGKGGGSTGHCLVEEARLVEGPAITKR